MANPQPVPQPPPTESMHGMSKSAPLFKYDPLISPQSSIRVVHLQPRNFPGTLEVSLKTATFASRPKYFALSYAWGPPGNTKTIYVDGNKLEVRKNLYDALLHLRDKTGSHTLWIDAICIDQTNIEERNQQVRLMAYIYTRAQHVIIWLGKIQLLKPTSLAQPEWLRVVRQPYWQRLWIVQEIGAASKISIKWDEDTKDESNSTHASRNSRSFSYTWEDFFEASRDFELDAPLPRKLYEQRKKRHGDGFLLANLMEVSSDSLCEDPRDKIYGLMGIAHDCQNGSFPLDYSKSLFEVYADAMTFHQTAAVRDVSKAYVDVLQFSHLVFRMFGGAERFADDMLLRGLKDIPLHQQSKTSLDDIRQTLTIAGIPFGSIKQIGPSYEAMLGEPTAWSAWKAMLTHCDTDVEKLRRKNEEFLRILVDLESEDLRKVRALHTKFMFKMDGQMMKEFGRHVDVMIVPEAEEKEGKAVEKRINEPLAQIPTRMAPPPSGKSGKTVTAAEKLFITKNGTIGLVPGNAREGDFLVQCLGTDVVIIARSPSEESPFCQIIGRGVIANQNEDATTIFQVLADSDDVKHKGGFPMDFQNTTVRLQVDMMSLYNLTC